MKRGGEGAGGEPGGRAAPGHPAATRTRVLSLKETSGAQPPLTQARRSVGALEAFDE